MNEPKESPQGNVDSEISQRYREDMPNASAIRFVAIRHTVMRGKEHICTAVSGNMAQRIARALNMHPANRRGQ